MPRGIFLHSRDTKEKSPGARATGAISFEGAWRHRQVAVHYLDKQGTNAQPQHTFRWFSSSSAAPIDWRYLLVSSAQKEKPRSGNRGFISWRVHGTGRWHPPSSASILIQRKLSQAVPQAPEFFRRQQQTQDTCGTVQASGKYIQSRYRLRVYLGTGRPSLVGDFRGLYFSLQHDVWSRTMKALFVLLCPTAAGNASDYW